MTDPDDVPKPSRSGNLLLHQTVTAGMLAASARFVPIPFVDDAIRDRCRRYVVAQTLAAHGNPVSVDDMRGYYGSQGGCLAGCAGLLVMAPLKVVLFPIRKIVTIFTSVRGVPLEIMRTVLLGRTLDRYLQQGNLTDVSQAATMRTAFDVSFARMDFRTVRAAMRDALRSASGWKSSAIKAIGQMLDGTDNTADDLAASPPVEKSADQVQEVLTRPETLALFDEFDRRFDEALQAAKMA